MAGIVERVVVINDDSVESGGAASIALASSRLLRKRGIAVTLLTGGEAATPDLRACGVDVVPLGGRHILDGNRAVAAMRGLYSHTTRTLLQNWITAQDTPQTVYHLHNWHKVLSASVFIPLRRIAPRLVISTHDFFLACPNGGYFRFPRGAICDLTPMTLACLSTSCDKRHYGHKLWRTARYAVQRAFLELRHTPATILAVHDGMVPLLQRGGIDGQAVRVLRNPVSPWRHVRIAAERNRLLLFVGRLELDKGVDVLARAARRLGAPLRVIGDGPLRDAIRRDNPSAELLGHRSRHEISELSVDARVLVLPTRVRETFGLAALEGGMSGIPVISSASALIAGELVRLGMGVACPPGDEDALAQAIARLMDDDLAVAGMSRRGFEHGRTLAPTADEWCDALIAIYEDKISEARDKARTRTRPAVAAKSWKQRPLGSAPAIGLLDPACGKPWQAPYEPPMAAPAPDRQQGPAPPAQAAPGGENVVPFFDVDELRRRYGSRRDP